MSAGQLRHRVTLQSAVATQGADGQPSTAWVDNFTTWADVRYQSGLSAIKSGVDVAIGRASVRLRHRAVNAGQRVVFGTQVFTIEAVLPDVRKAYVDLVCVAANVAT